MKNKLKKLIIIVGLLLGLLGFLLAHEKNLPLVSELIYKRVVSLQMGFNDVCGLPVGFENTSNRYRRILTGDLVLNRREEGFEELSQLILDDLKRDVPKYFAKTWSGTLSMDEYKDRARRVGFSKFVYQGLPGNGQGMNATIGNNRINAYLSDSNKEYASFFVYALIDGIEDEHRNVTFAWSSFVYFLGLFIQVFQFDWKGDVNSKKWFKRTRKNST